MKKSFFLFFAFVMVLPIWAQNNVITYTASAQLVHTSDYGSGFHPDAFDVNVIGHTFGDGVGTIMFSGDVSSIGDYAFNGCSDLTSITIPSSVTSIGKYAFGYCPGLTSITIPNRVTSLGYGAFYRCIGLTSLTIPSSVSSIGNSAFYHCVGLKSVVVESGNTIYDSRDNCNAIIETAGNTLIYGCKNTVIPNNVTSIGKYAFEECFDLTSIVIPYSVTSIENFAFKYCTGLTSITIPSDSIGFGAFQYCTGLTSVTILGSVTSIGGSAFADCSGLTSIDIPRNVTNIEGNAFSCCSGLTSITCRAITPLTIDAYVFQSVPRNIPLYVPAASIPLYQAAANWNTFDIQPILVDIDSISQTSTNLSWLPVDSAAMYQLHLHSDRVAIDTTLSILANPYSGGTHLLTASSPYRQHRIVLDDGAGTLVVVVFDDNSGATTSQPYVVSVSTSLSSRIDIQYDMTVLGISNNIIRQESGIFTLNEGALLYDALDEVSYSPAFVPSSCFDLRGNRYPLSQWSSLPAGIYILHDGTSVRKILRH